MTSRYQGWSPERLEIELAKYKEGIRNYRAFLSLSDKALRSYAQIKIDQWNKIVEELEDLIKPKIDYEDGTWV